MTDPSTPEGAVAKVEPTSQPANPTVEGGSPGTSQPPAGGAADPGDAGAVLDQFIQTLPENVREQAGKDLAGVRKGVMFEKDYRQKTAEISKDRSALTEYRKAMADPMVASAVGHRFNMPDMVDPRYAWLAEGRKAQGNPGAGSPSGDGIPDDGFATQKELVEHVKSDLAQTIQDIVTKAVGPLGQKIGGMEARTEQDSIAALEERDPRAITQRDQIQGFIRMGLSPNQAFHAAMGDQLAEDLTKTGRELEESRVLHGKNLESEPESGGSLQTVAGTIEKGKSMVEIQKELRARKLLPSQTRSAA